MAGMRASRGRRLRLVGKRALVVAACLLAGCWSADGQTAAQLRALHSMHPQVAEANGVQATTVPLLLPGGLAYDTSGNLYVASTNDHVIRKIDTFGIINTIAGSGTQGFAGDGGAATSAQLDSPVGIALDGSENLYIADTHNQRIREVTAADGIIHTIAGTGVVGFSGDGGAALLATFNLPTALATDANGSLYVADTNNHRIRRISGGTITTVAGDGEQTYSGDGGPAILAGLDSPNGVAAEGLRTFYIGDTHNQRVRMVTLATGVITTFAGTGAKTYSGDGQGSDLSALARPRGLAVAFDGTLLIADSDNNRVRLIRNGTITTAVGNGSQGISGDSGPATDATLDTPRVVASTAQSGVVVADTDNQRVRAVSNAGTLETIAGVAPTDRDTLTLNGAASTVVYGTGSLLASLGVDGVEATGGITFYEVTSGAPVAVGGAVSLVANSATFDTSALAAGTHSLVATYSGDVNHAGVSSGVFLLRVTPSPLTATANVASIEYGQAIPALGGTLDGVLVRDRGNVAAVYSATAAALSPVGAYPIAVTLTGPAGPNYTVSLATPAALTITQAGSQTVLVTSNAAPSSGMPLQFTATVSSLTSGSPTGTVSFYNGDSLLNATPILVSGSGVATFSSTALPPGTLSILAVYSGDANFKTSTSAPVAEQVGVCDFTLSPGTGPQQQTVAAGGTASYAFSFRPATATSQDAVSFTVSGLPKNASYTLTPSALPAGSGTTGLTLVIRTTNPLAQSGGSAITWLGIAMGILLLPFAGAQRMRSTAGRMRSQGKLLVLLLASASALGALTGCCTTAVTLSPESYAIVLTAVSGCGSHAQTATLIVQ